MVELRQNQNNSKITGLPRETVHVLVEDSYYTTACPPFPGIRKYLLLLSK